MRGPCRHPVLTLCLFLLTTLHLSPVRSAQLDNLDLANRLEQYQDVEDIIANPHDMSCDECHEVSDTGGRFLEYIVADDTIELCRTCHEPSHLHPVGVPASEDEASIEQIWLPLGKGKFRNRVVCLTCHYVHGDRFRRNILRGDDEKGRDRQTYLCGSCHTSSLISRSPHSPDSQACTFCHTSAPKEGQAVDEILNPSVQASCDFCHGALDNAHFLAVNPFADPDVTWRFDKVGIPLLSGRFTCISCHDPHAVENRKQKMLRPSYLTLAARSDRINPHWKEVMCISCHDRMPREDAPGLNLGGDINLICGRCHNGRYARKDIHPVGVIPTQNVEIPPDMPLTDGKLTCETCHDSSLQEGGEGADSIGRVNPKFLRGGFNVRNEFCFRCHLLEKYGKMNAHNQLDEGGEVKVQSCLFCHTSPPDVRVIGIRHVGFNTDSLDDYCICCHGSERFFENHPRGPHLVEPSDLVLEAIETSIERIGVELPLYEGMVTCATCHNPHEAGVIRIEAAAKGSSNRNRLRLGDSFMLCRGCHTDK